MGGSGCTGAATGQSQKYTANTAVNEVHLVNSVNQSAVLRYLVTPWYQLLIFHYIKATKSNKHMQQRQTSAQPDRRMFALFAWPVGSRTRMFSLLLPLAGPVTRHTNSSTSGGLSVVQTPARLHYNSTSGPGCIQLIAGPSRAPCTGSLRPRAGGRLFESLAKVNLP